MSNIKIQGNASGTGTTTLQSGNTNTSFSLALPVADGTNGQVLTTDGAGVLSFASNGTGDVAGPASSTDNAITRFDSTTGKLLQNSLVTVADNGAIVAPQAGSVIPFYFANQAAFPSATTYDGAVAHSDADGAMFFANGGSWVRILDNGGPLGTPSSGTATNLTGLPISTGVSGLGTGVATFLGTPSSANLAAALTDETGSGLAVFATSPTLVTPNLGTPSAAVLTSATGLPLTTGVTGTLPVSNGGTGLATLTANNVIIGNGTSTPSFVAPSTAGNVLTSNGTTWASAAAAAGGVAYTAVKTANYTAVNNDGVLTNTTGGAFTVTLPTSPAVGNIIIVVDSFSQWGTNNLTIDPTASIKIAGDTAGNTLICDITGATVTLVYTGATYGWNVSAQVGGNGGTVVTLDGIQTLTGTKTFSGTASTLAMVVNDVAEVVTASATAATGTINYDITTQSVLYYTSNASANWTVNFRASSGTSLNTAMSTGQSVTVAFLVTNGATAYYNNVVQVDGTTITPKFQGGTAYTTGNANSIDVYMYTIIKTASATFTILASQTKFA